MKKVLFLITKSNMGGAQRYVYDLATNLPRDSFDVVVASGPAQGSDAAGALVERLTARGVRTILVPELVRDIGNSELKSLSAIRKILRTERPDVLHLNSSKAGLWGAIAGRLEGVPRIVFTAHGWPFQEQRSVPWKTMAWLGSVATALLAHRVLCVSEHDRRSLGWLLGHKLVTVRNAVPAFETLSKIEARNYFDPQGLHADATWVGSISELNANKNITLGLGAVARAIADGHRMFYAVVGDGEERAALEAETQHLGIGSSVLFAGSVPDARRYLAAFDTLMMPSRKEGLPYAILEAQAAGIPVVASAVGGIPELITDERSGIICPLGDTECFANGITRSNTLHPATPSTHAFEQMLRETLAQY